MLNRVQEVKGGVLLMYVEFLQSLRAGVKRPSTSVELSGEVSVDKRSNGSGNRVYALIRLLTQQLAARAVIRSRLAQRRIF